MISSKTVFVFMVVNIDRSLRNINYLTLFFSTYWLWDLSKGNPSGYNSINFVEFWQLPFEYSWNLIDINEARMQRKEISFNFIGQSRLNE